MRWIAVLGGAALLAGCFRSQLEVCDNGVICPQGLVCAPPLPYCVFPDEASACAMKIDGEACSTLNITDGVCVAGACQECTPDTSGCEYVGWQAQTSGTADELYDVWADRLGHAYAAGANGTLLEYGGRTWERIALDPPPAPNVALTAITGTAADSVYVLAQDSGVYHFDGAAWTRLPQAPALIKSIWSGGPDHLVAVGPLGKIQTFDGASWSEITLAQPLALNAVWGTSTTTMFAVGNGGAIARFVGGTWMTSDAGTAQLQAVWGSGDRDVFAVGSDRTILHFDGGAWQPMVVPAPVTAGVALTGVWGTAPDDVFVAGADGVILHYDGVSWSPMIAEDPARDLDGIAGSGSRDVYAVGTAGAILHYTGAAWSPLAPHDTLGMALLDVWAAAPDHVFAVGGGGTTLRSDQASAGAWIVTREVALPLFGVTGTSASDVVAVGDESTLLHFTTVWDLRPAPMGTIELRAVARAGSRYVAVGGAVFASSDGVSWTQLVAPDDAPASNDVWSPGGDELYLAGQGIYRVTAGVVGDELFPGTFNAIWGSDPDDIFAVGADGSVAHFDGSAWSSSQVSDDALNDVFGTAADDVLAVGEDATLLRYDGVRWETLAPPPGELASFSAVTINGQAAYVTGSTGKLYKLLRAPRR